MKSSRPSASSSRSSKRRTPRRKKGGTLAQPSVAHHVATHPVISLLSRPVSLAASCLPRKHKKVAHVTFGALLMVAGSFISYRFAHAVEGLGSVAVDAGAWGLHGFGCAPIIKVIADACKLDV